MGYRSALKFGRAGALTIGLAVLGSGCEADTKGLGDLPAGAASDGGVATEDGGPSAQACTEPNPAGCAVNACPPNLICDSSWGCTPSHCECTGGRWSCTEDCGGGTCRPVDLLFRLSYQSDVPTEEAVIQRSGGTPWINVVDSDGVELFSASPCGYCPCEPCGQCANCPFLPAETEAIGPGHPAEFRWDATYLEASSCSTGVGAQQACQAPVTLRPGRYRARFCYGYQTVENRAGRFVEPATCRDVPFDWPTLEPVELDVCDCG